MKTKLTLLTALAGLFTFSVNAQETKPAAPGGAPGSTPGAPGSGPGGPGGRGEGGRGRFQPDPETLKKYDKDGDGKLSDEERQTMRADREKEMLAKYDADKDGKLNDEERKKMETENPRRGGPGGPGGRFQPSPEDLKKYDKDGDGKLSDEERRAWGEGRRKEMLEKYDADKDGQLSEEERTKMMDDFRKMREAGGGSGRGPDSKPADKKPEEAKIPVPEVK